MAEPMSRATELQKLLSQNRQDLGQRVADIPKTEDNLRAGLFENDQTLNSLRQNQQAKILEMYQHDKTLAQQYANPESNLYLKDPYQRELARSTQFQGTAGELGSINNLIQSRRDVLGDTLDKAMKLAQYGVQAKQLENQLMQQEFENEMKMQSSGGELDSLLSLPELQALNLPYGTTKRQAAQLGLTPSSIGKMSATEQTKLNAWQATGSVLDRIEQAYQTNPNISGTIPGLETTAAKGQFGSNIPIVGGLISNLSQNIGSGMVDPNALQMDASLNTLRSSVTNALSRSGSNTNQETISQYVPTIYDTPKVFKQKLIAARNLINSQVESIAGTTNQYMQSLGGVNGLQPPSYFVPDQGVTATDYYQGE
jgi:hypothetical protein